MIRRWWHRLWWVTCEVCGQEFRKGQGSGVSRSVMCSDRCYQEAWRDFFEGPRRRDVS
jgi:hypothetical protein